MSTPDEMHELIEYDHSSTGWTMSGGSIDGLQPDVIFSHDDWGTKDALFMTPGDVARILQGAATAGFTAISARAA